ncbi:MAG: hypothetical protein HUU22_11205 [Phycisphaerae bacterium]|nr:hypothetical protein [Phycisphaerae bacterium]NUQ46589.1 hypothetical protein [Phycisphaerae bacterium]
MNRTATVRERLRRLHRTATVRERRSAVATSERLGCNGLPRIGHVKHALTLRFAASRTAAAIAIALHAASAFGHDLSVSRGTVTVADDRLAVTLEVPAEDLLHLDPAARRRSDACSAAWLNDARARYEPCVLKALAIHDTRGRRLTGRVVSSAVADALEERFEWNRLRRLRVRYTMEYAVESPRQFLTFRLCAAELPLRIQSQLVLDVRRAGDRSGREICLTSRGNAETLEFSPASSRDSAASQPAAAIAMLPAPQRFTTVFAIIDRTDEGLIVEVHVPLPLLETWRPVARADADFLEPAEQSAACAALTDFIKSALYVHVDDAVAATAAVSYAAFIPPQAARLDARAEPQRLSAWTARLAVVLRYTPSRSSRIVQLKWGLFNNAVITARALVRDADRAFEHEFSTYDPLLRLVRQSAKLSR